MLPDEYLCVEHKKVHQTAPKWPLYRIIEEIRRSQCECDVDILYQWYDLIGQFLDMYSPNSDYYVEK